MCQGISQQTVFVMDTHGEIMPGRQAREFRKARIQTLLEMFRHKKGWREAFFTKYPQFNNTQGVSMINSGFGARTSNYELWAALEAWVVIVLDEKPDWFTKSESLVQA